MPLRLQSSAKAGGVDVIAHGLVLQILAPVDVHRAGDVAGIVEQHVFIALDDAQAGILEVLGEPGGAHQHFGVGIVGSGFAHDTES